MWKLIWQILNIICQKKNSILTYLLLSLIMWSLVPKPLLIMNEAYLPIWTLKRLYSLETGSFVWYTEMLKTRPFTHYIHLIWGINTEKSNFKVYAIWKNYHNVIWKMAGKEWDPEKGSYRLCYNNRELNKHMRTTHHIHLKGQDKNVFWNVNEYFTDEKKLM